MSIQRKVFKEIIVIWKNPSFLKFPTDFLKNFILATSQILENETLKKEEKVFFLFEFIFKKNF